MADAAIEAAPGALPAAAPARRSDNGVLNAIYVATFGLVVSLVTVPLIALIYGSFRTSAPGLPGEWTLRNYAGLASSGVLSTIGTTLWIGLISSALCIVIGTAIALVVHRTDFRYGNLVTALIGLAFYFPSFILAMAWIIIGAPGGIFNALVDDVFGMPWLRSDIYTAAGIIFVMVLHQVPFVYLTMRGPIVSMDAIYEEAARTSGAKPHEVLYRVTLPLLSYSLISSFILTFIITIEQFAIPALIGIPGQVTMLATQLYLLVRFSPADYGLAAAIGLALSAITGAAIWAQRRVARTGRLTTITGKAGRAAPIPLGRWKWPAYILCFGFVFLGLILPMVILHLHVGAQVVYGKPDERHVHASQLPVHLGERVNGAELLEHADRLRCRRCGGRVAGTPLCLLHPAPPPDGASHSRLRREPPLRGTGDRSRARAAVGLRLPAAAALWDIDGHIIAFVTRFLPYATETIGGQLVQIDKSLEEAAWVGGATRLAGVRRILLPIARPSVQSAYFLLFMAFFREISSAILLYSASTMVISISIWAFFEQANWGLASALSVIAILIIFIAMSLVLWLMPAARRA